MTNLILALISMSIAQADDWLCTSEASQKRDTTILACGIGHAGDENGARAQAFENAKKEFDRICTISDDCRGRKISVVPNRTACEQKGASVTCRRLLSFQIGEEDANAPHIQPLDPIPVENFKPFSSAQLTAYPRVKKGMKLSIVAQIWGKPSEIKTYGSSKFVTYNGPMCADGSGCKLTFYENLLDEVKDVRIEYDGIAIE